MIGPGAGGIGGLEERSIAPRKYPPKIPQFGDSLGTVRKCSATAIDRIDREWYNIL